MSAMADGVEGTAETVPSRMARVALWWAKRGVGVVPLRSSLAPSGSGKLSPVPWIRWQLEGPLRGRKAILQFWEDSPDAQLAVLLEDGLAAVDVDVKHLPQGMPPPGHPIPEGPGYKETTKSGGLHFVFLVKERLDSSRPSRVTGLAGYVDVFTGGLLVVAPSRFANAYRGYEILYRDIPVFSTMVEALETYASWLPPAWMERWAPGERSGTPPKAYGPARESPIGKKVDLVKVAGVIRFLEDHPDVLTVFDEGIRHPDGTIDRSLTEFKLVSILKSRGFSRETCWDIVRLCPHTKSPQDLRGWHYFQKNVWSRLP
jgi:hypothetical protein